MYVCHEDASEMMMMMMVMVMPWTAMCVMSHEREMMMLVMPWTTAMYVIKRCERDDDGDAMDCSFMS